MPKVTAIPLPPASLLAQHLETGDYGDCFAAEVPGQVTLPQYITRFYSSPAFWPERKLLGLIGKGANPADIAALAEGRVETFAAWIVEARHEHEILLRDFRGATRSWLSVVHGEFSSSEAIEQTGTSSSSEAVGQAKTPSSSETRGSIGTTQLLFGSGVMRPDRPLVRALMPFHKKYARVLLAGAVQDLVDKGDTVSTA